MTFAFDANVLLYVEGIGDEQRVQFATNLIARLPLNGGVIAAQALGEVYNVLVRKGGHTRAYARSAARRWQARFPVLPTAVAAMDHALDLAAEHLLTIWDALQLAIAAEAGCRWFLSEDLQDGFTWRGVTVVNPFRHPLHPQLAALFD